MTPDPAANKISDIVNLVSATAKKDPRDLTGLTDVSGLIENCLADCRLQWCLADICTNAAVGDDWRKVGVAGQFQAGNQDVRIQWYATDSCTATELYIDDVGLYYTPELSPTVYTIDDVYDALDQMRQADETFHTDTGFMLAEIHHDDHGARHLATTLTTTFQLDDEQTYQIATIGTYTDGERAMITCLIALVMLQVFQFLRKEIKG